MKKFNTFLIIITICFSLIYLIINVNSLTLSQILVILSIIPVLLLVRIIRKIFKLKIDDNLELTYIIFVIFAQLIGSVLQVYSILDYYDKFVHFLSGTLTSIFAITILNNTKLKNRTIVIDIIFIFSFTLAIASLWEFFEFISDLIFKGNAQNVETGVTDTMLDMILAFISSIIFSIIYYFKANKLVNN